MQGTHSMLPRHSAKEDQVKSSEKSMVVECVLNYFTMHYPQKKLVDAEEERRLSRAAGTRQGTDGDTGDPGASAR